MCSDSRWCGLFCISQLLQQSQQQSQRAQVEFKCGKMKKNDGDTRVTPDVRKGKLTVRADQDQLMHLIWTNREQGSCCFFPSAYASVFINDCILVLPMVHKTLWVVPCVRSRS